MIMLSSLAIVHAMLLRPPVAQNSPADVMRRLHLQGVDSGKQHVNFSRVVLVRVYVA